VRRRLVRALCWLSLAAATPAWGAGWNCSVRDELSANLPATMELLVGTEDGRGTLDFYIWWVPERGHAAGQAIAWIGVPRPATLLWKPDRIEFGIPGTRTDARGFLRFDSLQGSSLLSVVRPASVRSLRPNFDLSWVTIDDAALLAQLWGRPPGGVRYTDRRGDLLGSVAVQLPAAAEAQALFTRMRAALERKAADPAHHCRALPAAPDPDAWHP